jgi:hypothetical protein
MSMEGCAPHRLTHPGLEYFFQYISIKLFLRAGEIALFNLFVLYSNLAEMGIFTIYALVFYGTRRVGIHAGLYPCIKNADIRIRTDLFGINAGFQPYGFVKGCTKLSIIPLPINIPL